MVRLLIEMGGGALLALAGFSFVINLLMLTGPLFMLQIYDRVLSSGSVPTLLVLSGLVVGLYGFLGLVEMVRARLLVRVSMRLDERLRSRVFSAVMRLGARPGGAGTRANLLRDVDSLRQFVSSAGLATFFDVPWLPIYLSIIFAFAPLLGWMSAAAALVLLTIALLNETMTGRAQREASQWVERGHALAEESRRTADTAQALGMTGALYGRWAEIRQEASLTQNTALDRSGTFSAASRSARLLFQSAILALGAYLAILGQITPGTMIAASILMGRALAPVDQAVAHWRGFQTARQAWARLSHALRAEPDAAQRTQLPAPVGRLSVNGLSAVAIASDGRPGTDPIVQGIRFNLTPGDGLGIIGPSGSGKTTLSKALLGLWPYVRGEVRLDGATLDQWEPERLGRHIGYLPQEGALLPGTVAENIGRFMPDAAHEQIVAAAQAAGAHGLILGLADGYETRLGANGAGLSAGQRQRIALARALFGDPCLIVLDEPNANLDSEGDAALTRAIKGARERGATVLVIAHRPSALAAIDKVLFLRDGRQIAFGPRDEVLRQITQEAEGARRPEPPGARTISAPPEPGAPRPAVGQPSPAVPIQLTARIG